MGDDSVSIDPTTITLLTGLIAANHDALKEALNGQNKMLEGIQREVRKTNGSVADAVKRISALEQADAVEVGMIQQARREGEVRSHRRDLIVQATCVLGGGILASVGHALGLW